MVESDSLGVAFEQRLRLMIERLILSCWVTETLSFECEIEIRVESFALHVLRWGFERSF